jgi:hypothetical protein
MLLFHKKTREARFAGWSFVALAVLFLAIMTAKPVVGLSGLGAVLVLASLLVEANKDRIWESYGEHYKREKSDPLPPALSKPSRLYYQLNVYVAWPLVFLVGLAAIYAAYILA